MEATKLPNKSLQQLESRDGLEVPGGTRGAGEGFQSFVGGAASSTDGGAELVVSRGGDPTKGSAGPRRPESNRSECQGNEGGDGENEEKLRAATGDGGWNEEKTIREGIGASN